MQRFVPAGMDTGKPATGYKASSERLPDETGEKGAELISYRELTLKVITELGLRGYELVPSLGGEFAGFRVYADSALEVPGITPPRGWTYKRELRSGDPKLSSFYLTLRVVLEEFIEDDESDEVKGIYKKMYTALVDRPRDKNTTLAQTSLGLAMDGDARRRTIAGRSGCQVFVPRYEWFSPELQALDPLSLITILPEAERLQFSLIVGKMLAGSPGRKLSEGTLQYTMRAIVHLIDPVGGIGKSTLLDSSPSGDGYLVKGLETLGYLTNSVDPEMSSFSFGWVNDDYARLDDSTFNTLVSVLTHSNTKSVATHGNIFVNLKGIQGRKQKAQATLFLASNLENVPALLRRLDKAQCSRHQPLRCYTPSELKLMYGDSWGDYRIAEYWTAKAKELGVSTNSLMLRYLQFCLDMFLDAIGVTVVNENIVQDMSQYKLEELMSANKALFRADTELHHRSELMSGVLRLIAISASVNPLLTPKILQNVESLTLSPRMLHSLLTIWVHCRKQLPEWCKEMSLPSLADSCQDTLQPNIGDLSEMCKSQEPAKAFTAMVKHLRTKRSNIPYASGRSGDVDLEQYTGIFSQGLDTIKLMMTEMSGRELVDELPDTVLEVAQKLAMSIK